MPGQISGGELQTLVSTLQNGNVQLGNIYQAILKVGPVLAGGMGATVTSAGAAGSGGALPAAPDGYITVTIPGVGPRLIPYYPV